MQANQWHQHFYQLMQSEPITGLSAELTYYQQSDLFIPATYSHPIENNCYVVSPLTLIAGYALDEIPKINNALVRVACVGLVKTMGYWLKMAKLDQVQTLNNQCLSTNMYSSDWNHVDISELRQQALTKWSSSALVLRSLNHPQHKHIINSLQADNWISLVTRQVYLQMQWQDFTLNTDLKRDFKLLDEPNWTFQSLTTFDEFTRAKQLYDLLYLDKYSYNNIHFTVEYLQQAVQLKLLKLFGLFHQGEMLAVLGLVIIDGDMTCPIFGYQTDKPQKLGLYRRISAFTINYALQHNLNFNMSSGAPVFKANRKAKPCIEYSYIYIEHLPHFQRLTWKFIGFLGKVIYQPLLTHYKL